ncbi:MAG: multidrug resistance protein [Pseudomonadota bacterium]|jgi:MFS family permease
MKQQNYSGPGQAPKVLIFLTVFLYLVGFGIIIPILPLLGKELGGSAIQVGWLMAIYSLMQFLFAPFWGQLSDRHGRRMILVGCLLAEAFTYVWFAFARDFWSLLLARGLAGFFGASLSTASAYISDITPPKERSKGMALIGVAFGLGFVIGPAIGGSMIHLAKQFSSEPLIGSTVAALFVGALCLGTFVFAYFKLPESLPPEKRKTVSEKYKLNRFRGILNKFELPKLRPLLSVYFLSGLAMASMEATLVLFVGQYFGWSSDKVSYGFAYVGIIIVFTQGFLVRRLLPMLGERAIAAAGLAAFAMGMGGIAIAQSIEQLAVAMTLLSLGNGCVNPSMLGSISLASSETEQGENLGIAQSLSSLGRILGPLLGGMLFDSFSITAPFSFAMILGALALVIVLINFKSLPDSRSANL